MQSEYASTMSRLHDSELLVILESKDTHDPEAMKAAQKEWDARGLQDSDIEALRARRALYNESYINTDVLKLADGINYWKRLNAWVHEKPPVVQLFIWVFILQFLFEGFVLFESTLVFISNTTLIYYGWFYFLNDALIWLVMVASMALTVFLLRFKRWAYWVVLFLMAYTISKLVLSFPITSYYNWPWYMHYRTFKDIMYELIGGINILTLLMGGYLLVRPEVIAQFGVNSLLIKKVVIAGLVVGIISAVYYNWLALYNYNNFAFPYP